MRATWGAVSLLLLAEPGWEPVAAEAVLTGFEPGAPRARFDAALRVRGAPIPLPDGALLRDQDGVRVDWFDAAGGTVGSWRAGAGGLELRDAAGDPWSAPTAEAGLRRLSGGRLDAADALALLAGDPAGLGALEAAWWSADGIDAAWRGALPALSTHDPRTGAPRAATAVGPGGAVALHLRWTWREDGTLSRVELVQPDADAVLRLDYRE
jgi:hypothetical protein